MKKFEGVMPALITPLTAEEKLIRVKIAEATFPIMLPNVLIAINLFAPVAAILWLKTQNSARIVAII